MVLEHPSLAKEFVKHEGAYASLVHSMPFSQCILRQKMLVHVLPGVQVLRSRKLLSSDLVFSEKGAAVSCQTSWWKTVGEMTFVFAFLFRVFIYRVHSCARL